MSKSPGLTCVLVSGGLDSALLLHHLLTSGTRLFPLYLRCGFSWEQSELYWLRRFLRAIRTPALLPLRVVETPLRSTYGSHWSLNGRRIPGRRTRDAAVYLPGRNALLLSYAAIVCAQRKAGMIALGTLQHNPFGDASPRFFRAMSACLSRALHHPLHVTAPLRRAAKAQWIRAAHGIPLQLTFSCIRPRGHRHCGRCNKCAERRRAFRAACVTDPTRYAA